ARMNLQQPMPLQTTLMALCQEAAGVLRRRGFLSGKFGTELAVLFDAAMHGTVAEPDLRGFDPSRRVILIKERNRTGVFFDRSGTAESVLRAASEAASVFQPEYAQVFSLQSVGNAARFRVAAGPRATHGPTVRPPAVAGRFYPGDAAEMDRMLDELVGERPQPERFPACMVPHAGWRFSGRLAADVLKRIAIPEIVIAIGPKHTPHGVDWSVAPHHFWQLPGDRRVASDYALAQRLAARIPRLELDAAAHAREHGVEVELPIIQRLAPDTKVVGIAVGAGALEHCEQFADGLAEVVRSLPAPPLLLISSDMNHYANDAETRRLDAMALERFDALDPDGLFHVCRRHHISMCGLLPAVIVLKTLQRLGCLRRSVPVGYATSADATGDPTRVVGYAGRLVG
ncbi:MAG: AmmeMemoRadiSam system protein B, partial [Planctomycetota bacterium]